MVVYSREMVLFLKNNFIFYNHRILYNWFKIKIFDNSFIINMWLYLIFYEKYKKFSIVLEIFQKK